MKAEKWILALAAASIIVLVLMACAPVAPAQPAAPQVVKETVVVQATVVTEKQVVVTATPPPTAAPVTGPVQGGTLKVGVYQDYTGVLPNSGGGGWPLFVITTGFYDTLLEFNEKFELQPGLAQSYELQDGDKTILLKLQSDVKFQDGTPFNAEAVKVNLERLINPKGLAITNIADVVDSVEVVDPSTVKIHLKSPNIAFLYSLTQQNGMMISPTALKDKGEEWLSQNPVGTGPYKLESWEPGSELVMVRNPDYWRKGLPYLDRIEWKNLPDNTVRSIAFATNDINLETFVAPKDYNALKTDPQANLWVQPGGLAMVTFNHKEGPFTKKENREAVKYAIDYGAIRDKIYYGLSDLPTGGPFPSGMWTFDKNRPRVERDLAKAKELLAAAGNPNGFEVSMIYEPEDIGQQLAETVQASLAEVGIKVNLMKTDFARFIEILQKDRNATQMAIFTYGRMRVNPEEYFTSDWTCDGSNAFADMCSKELDETVAKSGQAFSYDERLKLMHQAEDIFIDNVAGAPLAYPPFIHATKKDIQDYAIHPIGLLGFRWLWMNPASK